MNIFIFVLTLILSGIFTMFLLGIGHIVQRKVPFLHDPVYVPSSDEAVTKMLQMVRPQAGERAADLGSGDGRVVLELAKRGCVAIGYEINPLLVRQSRKKILEAGLQKKAAILRKSFWKADLSQTNIVVLYTTASIMQRLEEKLQSELPHGSRVASQEFTFPHWKPKNKQGNIYLYIKE